MKSTFLLSIVLIITFFQTGFSQNNLAKKYAGRVTLSGKVTDEATGLPLHACSIYIPDLTHIAAKGSSNVKV